MQIQVNQTTIKVLEGKEQLKQKRLQVQDWPRF